jgi:hypothetical protein
MLPASTREESEVRKPLTPMLSAGLNRRHVLAGLGAGLTATELNAREVEERCSSGRKLGVPSRLGPFDD